VGVVPDEGKLLPLCSGDGALTIVAGGVRELGYAFQDHVHELDVERGGKKEE
jgi:hypothetical protein